MENKKLTAVEWLIEQYEEKAGTLLMLTFKKLMEPEIKQAIELEKQQHEETWNNAEPIGFLRKTFEQYYSKTYKKPTE